MGIKIRNIPTSRKVISLEAATWLGVQGMHMMAPPENATAVADGASASNQYQNLSSNHVGLGWERPLLLNGSGTYAVSDPSGLDRNVSLPLPSIIYINCVNVAYDATFRITGVNSLGKQIVEIGSKPAGTQLYYTGKHVWSFIRSIEVLRYTGAAADAFNVGYIYKIAGGSVRPFPIAWEANNIPKEVAGILMLDKGGAVGGSWADNTFFATSLFSGAELNDTGGVLNKRFGAVNCSVTNPATNGPTGPIRYVVVPASKDYELQY